MGQKAGEIALKQRMRAELDKQVAEQKERNNRAKQEDKKWFENQNEEFVQWKQMEEMKKEHDRVKADAMKEAREQQVCHLRKLRADAVQKAKDEDIEMVQKVAAEVEKEKKLAEDKKQAHKEEMFKLLKESS